MARSKYKVAVMSDLPTDEQLQEEQMVEKSREYRKKDKPAEETPSDTMTMDETAEDAVESVEVAPEEETAKAKKTAVRSKRYTQARSSFDRSKVYALADAIAMLSTMPKVKFDPSVEVHLVLKEQLSTVEVAFPHSTGKSVTVEILSDETLGKLDKGQIDFDVLLATPAQMGKLTKYARLLGPKGLMPNPKNLTLVADPVKRKKELESGKVAVRGEKKAPLMHTVVGKLSIGQDALVGNVQALLNATQGKVLKAVVCTSMSPGIKIAVV